MLEEPSSFCLFSAWSLYALLVVKQPFGVSVQTSLSSWLRGGKFFFAQNLEVELITALFGPQLQGGKIVSMSVILHFWVSVSIRSLTRAVSGSIWRGEEIVKGEWELTHLSCHMLILLPLPSLHRVPRQMIWRAWAMLRQAKEEWLVLKTESLCIILYE